MKNFIPFLILIIIYSCSSVESEKSIINIDLTNDIVNPKHYIVSKTENEIKVDGRADDSDWNNAHFTDLFIDIEGIEKPEYNTRLKMLWDENYLYLYCEMQEPHIWGNIEKRDAIIYFNNDFEVFIDPSGTTKNYGEIEINPLGTIFDLSLDKPYKVGGKPNIHWDLKNLQSAIQIYGTINNYDDLDSLWTVEMAIPLKAFVNFKNKPKSFPKEGEQWRINFSRVEWQFEIIDGKYQRKQTDGKFLPENNWVWSPQKVINMHEPEKWGFLQFTNNITTEGVDFIEDEDLTTKQIAYAFFRRTIKNDLTYLLKNKVGTEQIITVKYSKTDSLKALFIKTYFGFEFIVNSPTSKLAYVINEEGVLKTIK
jgi:hypothetical protein